MKKNISIYFITKSLMAIAMACSLALATVPLAWTAENWKDSFDEICGKVQGAESLSEQELAALVEKADKLLPVIQASDNPAKKVYLQRLKKCRAVYEFMIDTKRSPGK